jgi:YARHG domain
MEFPLSARTFGLGIFVLMSGIGSSLGPSSKAQAQGMDVQQKLLIEQIPDTADRICYVVSQNSAATNKQLSGDVKAQVNGLVSKFVDVGGAVNGNVASNATEGVLQPDLAAAIRDSANCKLEVLKILVSKLLPAQPFPPSANGAALASGAAPVNGAAAPVAPNVPPSLPGDTGPKSAVSMSCDELWHERNAIFARNGYCFKTPKAIAAFGKSCFPPYGELQIQDKNRVTEISIWERQKGC